MQKAAAVAHEACSWSEDEIDIFGVWEAGKGSTNLLWKNKDGSQNRRFDLLTSVFVD